MSEQQESQQESQEEPKQETQPETVSLEQVEAAAGEQGWDREGELGALDFLAKGRDFRDRMFDEIKELRSENEKVYGMVAEKFNQQEQKDHTTEVKTWQEQVDEAKTDGDMDKLETLYKAPPQRPKSTAPDPNLQYIDTWRKDNKWFNEDADMRDDALGFYQAAKIKLGKDVPSEILPIVLKKMKKSFPDKFKAKESPNAERGAKVEKEGVKESGKTKGLQRKDLTADEGAHFDDFVEKGMKPERLLASIEKARARRG